jgi:hypothetical protein
VNVLTNLVSVVFVGQNLGLALGSFVKSRNFSLASETILVDYFIVRQILAGSDVLENDNIASVDGLALLILTNAVSGLDSPHSVVGHFASDWNLLVAGEASVHHRSDRQALKVQGLFHHDTGGADSDVLTVADTVVGGAILAGLLNDKDGAGDGANVLLGGSHGVSFLGANNSVPDVGDEPSLGLDSLNHDLIVEFEVTIGAASVSGLKWWGKGAGTYPLESFGELLLGLGQVKLASFLASHVAHNTEWISG